MREVTTMCQIQTHELVSGVEHSQKDGSIGLSTRVGLYVGPFCTEDLLQTVDSDALALIHHFAASVIALTGIAFSILVG